MAQKNCPQPRTDLTATMVVYVGRKQVEVDGPVRVALQREIETSYYRDIPFNYIASESISVFVGERLFATVRPSRTRRRPGKLIKPLNNRGPIELHLVKKNTTLH